MKRKNLTAILGLMIAVAAMTMTGCGNSETKETTMETSTQEDSGADAASSATYKVTYDYKCESVT